MDYIWIATFGAIVLSAIYWFFIRDDNLFDSNQEPLVLKIKTVSSKELTQPKKSIVKNKDGLPLKILFYSQTGTAEDFARRLGDDANNYGFSPDVMDVDSVDEPFRH
jgi:sulfite reductase alpha subunit-like flavoprotein